MSPCCDSRSTDMASGEEGCNALAPKSTPVFSASDYGFLFSQRTGRSVAQILSLSLNLLLASGAAPPPDRLHAGKAA